MPKYEQTGNVNFEGLTNSLTDSPKQSEVRDVDTGETFWVQGQAGDGNAELGKHIANGDIVKKS